LACPVFERKIRAYYQFNCHLRSLEPVDANVHFIASAERKNIKKTAAWHQFTHKSFITYKGLGSHNEMFNHKFVEKNADIVKTILDNIYMREYNECSKC
jgi:hypothetical protein